MVLFQGKSILRKRPERRSLFSFRLLEAAALTVGFGSPLHASRSRVAMSELVIDFDTGRTIFEAHADERRPPASLAKLMTLLLTFDAIDRGILTPGENLSMTAAGERQAPSKLGLRRGKTIAVRDALRAIAVISANDLSVALADRLAGSEARFVQWMNRRAAQIGMMQTNFGNATGLAPGAGSSTARDMAILSRYIIRHYPRRYKLFATRSIKSKNWIRPNHNRLLGKVKGLDGLKTGYTVQAGFNLAASAKRGKRRMIVVVMGAETATARDLLVANLLEIGLSSPSSRSSHGER